MVSFVPPITLSLKLISSVVEKKRLTFLVEERQVCVYCHSVSIVFFFFLQFFAKKKLQFFANFKEVKLGLSIHGRGWWEVQLRFTLAADSILWRCS